MDVTMNAFGDPARTSESRYNLTEVYFPCHLFFNQLRVKIIL